MHVPQVPCTHASPPPHWLLVVHAPQAPFTHARPGAPAIEPPRLKGLIGLHSVYAEQGLQTPPLHTCVPQSAFDWHAPQVPLTQLSPVWQSAAVEHLHDPLGQLVDAPLPHCALDVQDPQTPATHA
jgi:hypothetical protein